MWTDRPQKGYEPLPFYLSEWTSALSAGVNFDIIFQLI